ncbi:hypothetical protein [Alloalcanivorax mobilis]|uniref:hypothetical protein n=1 Tax=Alloalcanivorax mobilis TaxID=2019569 RepID=UPI000C765B96|nr:hypothetical protein [Alloalcanivorax mobilis]
MEFANKTQIQFEPGAPAFGLTAAGEAYDTPEWFRDRLGDLSRLQYIAAEWAVELTASEVSAGVVTVELLAGSTVVDSIEVGFSAGATTGVLREVDLFGVGGGQRLHVRATVTTEGAGTAAVKTWLSIAQPLVVGSCG